MALAGADDEDEDEDEVDHAGDSDLDDVPESVLHQRLLSSGLSESDIRDHRRIGFFYDSIRLELPTRSVVLNTGDVVDLSTAQRLVSEQANMPNGRVQTFFISTPIRRLLETLVEDEVNERESFRVANSSSGS